MTRFRGVVVEWNGKYGYIRHDDGRGEVFLHVSEICTWIAVGKDVDFELVPLGKEGRTQAGRVVIVSRKDHAISRGSFEESLSHGGRDVTGSQG